jgi:hypothetical protein
MRVSRPPEHDISSGSSSMLNVRAPNARRAVEKLMFPVKHACAKPRNSLRDGRSEKSAWKHRARTFIAATMLAGSACGYRAEYDSAPPAQRLSVTAAPALVARPEAVQATLAGVRQELASAGALRPGKTFPRVVVEITRLDETAIGIAEADGGGEGSIPLGRGSAVGVLGRAWVEETAGARPARDTGDVRRVQRYASSPEPRIEAQRHSEAMRSAARELGRALGRRILGYAEPAVEPI